MAVDLLSLRRFAMVHSFLRAAVDALDDPLFTQIGVRESIETDEAGKPLAPDALARFMGQLQPSEGARLVSSSCVAAVNLGYAYEHAFKLINHIDTGRGMSMRPDEREALDRLYDELSEKARSELEAIYQDIKSHEYEIEEKFGDSPNPFTDDQEGSGSPAFRRQLNYWQSNGLLQGAREKYADPDLPFHARILIPLRSVEIVDRILSDVLAPRLGLQYTRMSGEVPLPEQPKVEWKDATLFVSIPDKRGRVISASWKPTVTSVIRIRPVGEERWSVGFETPLNSCSFVGLEPGVEYDVKLTHKNAVGESEPAYMKMQSTPDHSAPA
jgi:hypothetical protein